MSKPNPNRRSRMLVETEIQGKLAFRCVLYWFVGLCTIFLFVAVGRLLSGDSNGLGSIFVVIWRQYSVVALASMVLLPFVIWDVIRFSHRVVGPLQRLEKRLKKFADGEVGRPVRFRDSDFWHGLAEQYNRAIVNRGQVASGSAESSESNQQATIKV